VISRKDLSAWIPGAKVFSSGGLEIHKVGTPWQMSFVVVIVQYVVTMLVACLVYIWSAAIVEHHAWMAQMCNKNLFY
jgi:hypothetical protein